MDALIEEVYSTILPSAPYVLAAYVLVLAVLVVFVIVMIVRTRKTQKDIDALHEAIENRERREVNNKN